MSANDDQNSECPLCMEPLELDDLNFFPCTCGYQICRFCWHRIRTDENGLCPACRKQYPEDPADFKPLTHEELQRIKNEKRQKDIQRKQKMSDNRKHLANVRVVQKNLVFVVGLSPRLAEPEVLKRNEYFGKFGKIHKVVINHTTSYAGSQVFTSRDKGPSSSAYVTYCRVEDALRAIEAVNNIFVDGRTLKASLGTTKYCSHFLKGQGCPKPECMYLHEIGDDSASFTKEEMQLGKHQEYEKKLHEQLCNSARKQNDSPLLANQENDKQPSVQEESNSVDCCETTINGNSSGTSSNGCSGAGVSGSNKVGRNKGQSKKENAGKSRNGTITQVEKRPSKTKSANENVPSTQRPGRSRGSSRRATSPTTRKLSLDSHSNGDSNSVTISEHSGNENSSTDSLGASFLQSHPLTEPTELSLSSEPSPLTSMSSTLTSGFFNTCTNLGQSSSSSSGAESPAQCLTNLDSSLSSAASSLSSSSADALLPFFDARIDFSPSMPSVLTTQTENSEWMQSSPTSDGIGDVQSDNPSVGLTQHSSTDWQAAFGFTPAQSKDDDLGFDPWDESSKALADLMEKETSNVCIEPSSSSMLNGSHGVGHTHMDTVTFIPQQQQQQRPFTSGSQLSPNSSTLHDGIRRLGAPPGFTASHSISNAYNGGRPVPPAQHHQQQQHQQHQQFCQQSRQPSMLSHPVINGLSHSSQQQQQHVHHNGHTHQPVNLNFGMPSLNPHHQTMANHHHPYYGEPSPYLGMNGAPPKGNHYMKEIQGNNHTKDSFNVKEWQDNLRALFPNVNITFGGQNGGIPRQPLAQQKGNSTSSMAATDGGSWMTQDPAVVSAGCVTTARSDSPPHWMKSLQQLTEVDLPYANHRSPVVNHYVYRNSQWTNPTQIPPPGFGSSIGRSTHKPTEAHKMIDNF